MALTRTTNYELLFLNQLMNEPSVSRTAHPPLKMF